MRQKMKNTNSENAKVFKALCDETRLTVLSLLQSGEKCACVLLARVHVTQPTLSHHMGILVESGIVSARKEGKWMYYSISPEGGESAVRLLREIVTVSADTNGGSSDIDCASVCNIITMKDSGTNEEE
jgi:ArsR family transcriptional regulator